MCVAVAAAGHGVHLAGRDDDLAVLRSDDALLVAVAEPHLTLGHGPALLLSGVVVGGQRSAGLEPIVDDEAPSFRAERLSHAADLSQISAVMRRSSCMGLWVVMRRPGRAWPAAAAARARRAATVRASAAATSSSGPSTRSP